MALRCHRMNNDRDTRNKIFWINTKTWSDHMSSLRYKIDCFNQINWIKYFRQNSSLQFFSWITIFLWCTRSSFSSTMCKQRWVHLNLWKNVSVRTKCSLSCTMENYAFSNLAPTLTLTSCIQANLQRFYFVDANSIFLYDVTSHQENRQN